MNARQLITMTVAALFLIGGATAVGAAAPAEQAPETASDAATNAEDVDSTDDEAAANATDGVGPSDGLPEQVPDHVGSIHETITAFQNGEVDNLGESLSGLLGGGPADNADASTA